MPSIEMNDEKLYKQLKIFSELLKEPIESVVMKLLKRDIEWLKDNPNQLFDYLLNYDQTVKLLFGTQ